MHGGGSSTAMGGTISVDSLPGEGTCFSVSLPLPAAELAHVAVVTPSPETTRERRTILLVEDDPTVTEVIAGLLRARGHRVVHAAHGLAALTEVATAPFDAAVLDLDLPGMDGFALARLLRAQGFAVPLIALIALTALTALTARADGDAETQSMQAGFD